MDPSRSRICSDCGASWEFTEGEEQFLIKQFGADYAEPRRCHACRKRRKEQKGRDKNQDGNRVQNQEVPRRMRQGGNH